MNRHASSTSAGPLYAALADSVQALIAAGTLRPGHRIPSVRRMAQARTVSISTVLQAYMLLEGRGYLEARPQSGYYVRPRLPFETPEPRMARPMARPSTVGISDLAAAFMPDENKERLYNLLVEHDVAATEDDIHGDLHFEERRPKPLKAWDTDGRVLPCSSFGKTLATGVRVGWVAPGRSTERVRRLKIGSLASAQLGGTTSRRRSA